MALSTCSGQDVGYKQVVRDHFEAGMRELVCFTQYLLKAKADPEAYGKTQERIKVASQELSAAEEELEKQLKTVDARTEELVAKKKGLQDEQDEKKQSLDQLRIQLNSYHESERKAREMLEMANRHLGEMQAELRRKQEEADKNRLQRDIGIGLMFIPGLGTLIGSVLVGCGHVAMEAAEKAAHEAQEAVNRHTNEVSNYSAEIARYKEQERQMEAEIAANEQRLAQIGSEQQSLIAEQQSILGLQNELRKCVTFVSGLEGKVCVAKRLTEDLLIFEELANILGNMVQHVLLLTSLHGEGGLGFLATGEIQGLIEKLKLDSCDLRALANAEAEAIEY